MTLQKAQFTLGFSLYNRYCLYYVIAPPLISLNFNLAKWHFLKHTITDSRSFVNPLF